MSERKVGFWKWLWKLALDSPKSVWQILLRLKEPLSDPIVEVIIGAFVGIVYGMSGFVIAIEPRLANTTLPIEVRVVLGLVEGVFFLAFLHGWYRCEMEDC